MIVASLQSSAQASVNFNVTGMGGSGVTANVTFNYSQVSSTTGALVVSIRNTSAVGGQIDGFAFNVPTISGASLTKIGGVSSNGAVVALSPSSAFASAEGSRGHQAGWYGKWNPDSIATANGAGAFDFGVLNQKNWQDFMAGGAGAAAPRIANTSAGSDTTVFALKITGSGPGWLNGSAVETAFMNSLASASNGGPYNFAIRFSGLAGPLGMDTAVYMMGTTNPVPIPGAAVMAALGLGMVGLVRRRKA